VTGVQTCALPIYRKKFEDNRIILSKAGKFEAKKYYIIRGIDRGAEKDGVKFWRFKQNFKSQGVHDKLWKPIIHSYYKETGKLYNDPQHGIDLLISVVDNEYNGSTYRDVSAINPRRTSSPLHTDPLILKQWLEDKTTWRDVFKPKKAPGIDETKFLELASEEREPNQKFDMRNTPYYDEEMKKWIFPNHPDLEEKANTRDRNLDSDDSDEYTDDSDDVMTPNLTNQMSSNVAAQYLSNQSNDISNLKTSGEMPSFNHKSVDLSSGSQNTSSKTTAYDDLPF
jgi:hypothetical protein